MRLPAAAMVDNLAWGLDGSVWAVWRLDTDPWAFAPTAHKVTVASRMRALLAGLTSETSLMSVCAPIEADSVAARMTHGIDLTLQRRWASHVLGSSDDEPRRASTLHSARPVRERLAAMEMIERRLYVACRLADTSRRAAAAATAGAAVSWLTGWLGLTPAPPSRDQIERRSRQAGQLESKLGSHVTLHPIDVGELTWLYHRVVRRGLGGAELSPGEFAARRGRGPVTAVWDATFVEGTELEQRGLFARRGCVVASEAGTSFQSVLAVASMPDSWSFPDGGGEWFAAIDRLAMPVDWTARITPVPNAEAQRGTLRQSRQLLAQGEQYDAEVTGAPNQLAEALAGVQHEHDVLASTPLLPELRVTFLLAVAADDPDELDQRVEQLRSVFAGFDYDLPRPTGNQLQLMAAMLPAATAPPAVADYRQYLLPDGLASGAPTAAATLGDPTGMLLGWSLDTGVNRPVLFDPARGPATNRSGSMAIFGALGSGKSYTTKLLGWSLLARGGRLVALDRTEGGEYAQFAEVAPGVSQVVHLTGDAGVSIDPMRVFAGEERITHTVALLSLLMGVSPIKLEGATLAHAVRSCAAVGGRLADVSTHLRTLDHDEWPEARDLARQLDVFAAGGGLAKLIFGDDDPVNLTADAVVLWAPQLRLASREKMADPDKLSPDEVVAGALLYVLAAIARKVVFDDRDRFAAAIYDEAWALTASPQGRELLLEAVRDGRKHNAAVWLATQHVDDLGDDRRLAELIPTWMLFRCDRSAVPETLRRLGLDDDDTTVDVLARLPTGHTLLRDLDGRVGLVDLHTDMVAPEVAAAFDTRPASGADAVVKDAA